MKIWRPFEAIFEKRKQKTKDKESLVGRVARSVSGRDEGVLYVITGHIDSVYVTVCDGVRRGKDEPKRKNVRHLLLRELCVPQSFMSHGRLTATDAEIAAFLQQNSEI